MKTLLFLLIKTILADNDVILSSGLEYWNREQLLTQYNMFSIYSSMQIISASSILVYNIDIDGNLGTYSTNDMLVTAEDFQLLIKQQIGLLGITSIYCDATSNYCTNLAASLDKMYKNQTNFIATVIARMVYNHWGGLILDFEPDTSLDWGRLTSFIILLSEAMQIINKPLYVWIGYSTPYDDRIYFVIKY
jgi:hypothetical protein